MLSRISHISNLLASPSVNIVKYSNYIISSSFFFTRNHSEFRGEEETLGFRLIGTLALPVVTLLFFPQSRCLLLQFRNLLPPLNDFYTAFCNVLVKKPGQAKPILQLDFIILQLDLPPLIFQSQSKESQFYNNNMDMAAKQGQDMMSLYTISHQLIFSQEQQKELLSSKPEENDKDDNSHLSRITFAILAIMTFILGSLCLYNGYLLIKTGRLRRNVPLALFQFFSMLTLGMLWIYFMDFAFNYDVCSFNVFMTLPAYTYACMGYSYMMNCVKVILKDVSNDKEGNPKRKKLRRIVYGAVLLLIVSFITVYLVEISKDCENILNTSAIVYIWVWYYITFVIMMLLSFLQWQKLKSVKKTKRQQRRKHQLVTVAFGVSYLVRSVFNTIQSILGPEKMIKFQKEGGEYNIGWSMFLLFFHLLGELIPMTILFLYQYKSNQKWLKNKRLQSLCRDMNQGSDKPILKAKTTNNQCEYGNESDENDSYYDENECVPCGGAPMRISSAKSPPQRKLSQDENGEYKSTKKAKKPTPGQVTALVTSEMNDNEGGSAGDNQRAYSASQYSFEPYDDDNGVKDEQFMKQSSKKYIKNKDEQHSLLVTETGTGLRVSMIPGGVTGLHHQTQSLIAPSSGGNQPGVLMSTHEMDNYHSSAVKSMSKQSTLQESLKKGSSELGGAGVNSAFPFQPAQGTPGFRSGMINTATSGSSIPLREGSQFLKNQRGYSQFHDDSQTFRNDSNADILRHQSQSTQAQPEEGGGGVALKRANSTVQRSSENLINRSTSIINKEEDGGIREIEDDEEEGNTPEKHQ